MDLPGRSNSGALRGPFPTTEEVRLLRAELAATRADLAVAQAAIAAAAPILAAVPAKLDEAPNDGNYYGRKGGVWVRLTAAVLPPT